MNKLLAFFFFCFIVLTILMGTIEGSPGFAATELTHSITTTSTTIPVKTTRDFISSGYIWIGNEKIRYTSKTATAFTGLTRGVDGTTVSNHPAGSKVYNDESGVLNQLIGFNVGVTQAQTGTFSLLIALGENAITHALPKAIAWDYPAIFQGELIYLRFILLGLSAAFLITVALAMITLAWGIFAK